MAFWLSSCANDNASLVAGRQHSRLLVSLTTDDILLPAGLFQRGDLNGTFMFSNTLDAKSPSEVSARMRRIAGRWFLLLSLGLLFYTGEVKAQKTNPGGGQQAPAAAALAGINYDYPSWTTLKLPPVPASKRYVACYQMNYGNSSAQPYVLVPVHPKSSPIMPENATAFDVECDAISETDQDPAMRKWCKLHPKGSWSPCSPVDSDHPILMDQTEYIKPRA